MKKLFLILSFLPLFFGCKKETIVEYRIYKINRPGYACKYYAQANGKSENEVTVIAECGKYKVGDVILREIE